jgi:hypothetical protein
MANSVSCYEYLTGVWDGLTEESARLCTGAPVYSGQLRLVFMKYAGEHPELLGQQRGDIATAAFFAAFPCSK